MRYAYRNVARHCLILFYRIIYNGNKPEAHSLSELIVRIIGLPLDSSFCVLGVRVPQKWHQSAKTEHYHFPSPPSAAYNGLQQLVCRLLARGVTIHKEPEMPNCDNSAVDIEALGWVG